MWFLVDDDIQSLDLTGPFEVFAAANAALRHDAYPLRVVSPGGGAVRTESGLAFSSDDVARGSGRPHTLVIPGGRGPRRSQPGSGACVAAAQLGGQAERVVTVCTGAFVAAAAGLATGRRVATHWAYADELAARFPDLDVERDAVYVRDGSLWSSAGVTAGIDVALAVVEHDHGPELAQLIARHLVMFLRRPGGQSQFATPVWSERATTSAVLDAQHRIDADPGGDHRLDRLARAAGLSTRHFARCFHAETGVAPGAYVARVRIESARRELETSTATVDVIARTCGFGTAETMRRAFHRHLGVSPDDYRRRFRLTAQPIEHSRTS